MSQTVTEKSQTTPSVHAALPQRQLTDALKTVELSVPDRGQIQAQRGVVLTSARDRLTLSTFDFDTCLSVTVPADAAQAGHSLLDFGQLKRSVAALSAGESKRVADALPVSLAGDMLSTPDIAVPVAAYSTGDYSTAPEAVPATATVDAQDFLAQLERVLPCVGRDDTLPVLTAVKMVLDGQTLTLSGADRYRLAIAKVAVTDIVTPVKEPITVLLSGTVLRSLVKRTRKLQGSIGLGLSATTPWSTLSFGATQATMRHIEGTLPKLETMVPKSPEIIIQLDRNALYRATKKVEALQRARGEKHGPLYCTLSDDLTLTPCIGEDQHRVKGVSLPAAHLHEPIRKGREMTFGINPLFLMETLTTLPGESVTLHLTASEDDRVKKPILFTDGADPAGEGYQHLLMPVQLR